jgi:hypothetical protein
VTLKTCLRHQSQPNRSDHLNPCHCRHKRHAQKWKSRISRTMTQA